MLVHFNAGWRMLLHWETRRYTDGERGHLDAYTVRQRITLAREWEVLLHWRGQQYRTEESTTRGWEGALGLAVYF